MWTDFVLAFGRFFQWTFKILPPIGNLMNIILTLVGIALLALWCIELAKFGNAHEKSFKEKKKFPYM